MSNITLFDTFTVDGVRRTNDGYLSAFARVARTGIQIYRGSELGRPDLGEVRVYRSPEEVFSADALKSFAHRPVTFKHPPVPVTAKNWKKFAAGQTGDEVVRDGEYVRVPMVMMDAAIIDAYEKEGIRELSMGYSTDIKWRTGVTDAGEPYDAVQTDIRANHLAVVPLARGGDQLRIGDAKRRRAFKATDADETTKTCPECGDNVPQDATECPECGYDFTDDNLNDGVYPMKLVIDGLTVNVADDQSGGIIERHIATLAKQVKDAAADLEEMSEGKKKKQEELDAAKKEVQAKDGEIAVLKKQVSDAAVTPEKLDVMVKDRLVVIDAAKALVGDKYVFDGKTLATIRKDAVAVKLGDSVATMPEAAIEGAFLALTKDAKAVTSDRQIGDALRNRPHTVQTNVKDERGTAYDEMLKGLSDAWKPGKVA